MKSLLIVMALLTGITVGLAVVPASPSASTGGSAKVFPFDYHIDDLDNGLRLVTVPLPFPDLVALHVVVRTGSRNEVEPGKSGFAHFFEHMMFRGTEKYPPDKYNDVLKRMGADHNAYTSDDVTVYHMLFGKQDIEKAMELEADRFRNLKYPVEAFRTEAKAVLGEYNKNSANPTTKIFEVMRDKSFTKHTYKHTTMGFLKDIEDMPNQFEYSRTFFDRFYRPENVVVIVAGDVRRDQVLALVKKHWGAWPRGGYTQQIPVEPEASGPHTAHVDWPTPTLPWVVLGYRGPAYSDEKRDMASLDLVSQVAFSESSPLYQKLVIDEQVADSIFTFFRDSRDPGLLFIGARVKQVKDIDYVRDQMLATVEELRSKPVSRERLAEVKSSFRYGFALSMDNTASVAGSLANYLHLSPTPETINKVYAVYAALEPADLMEMSRKYFSEKNRTIGTLATQGTYAGAGDAGTAAPVKSGSSSAAAGSPDRASAPAPAPVKAEAPVKSGSAPGGSSDRISAPASTRVKQLLEPSQLPLVSFRLLFQAGAANDPEGKEGLAALTAAMLSRGGSRTMSYEQIVKALFPMAADVSAQVDKEMTVFSGTTHADNLDAYYRILSSMILDPGWDEDDFRRIRDDAVNFLKVNLRGNNDEELGKEALYQFIYGPEHPYGHENTGTLESLAKITLEDVKAFYKERYTHANLTLGLSGGYPEAFVAGVLGDLGRLPEGASAPVRVPEPVKISGQHLQIIRKETRATAISIGFPIPVVRSDKDWAALWLASSYLGQHRSSNSYLYQRMREARGLNYGDYAYVEYFPRGMFLMQPDPNLGRQSQIFQIWVRPVEPANGHFALRIALYELKKLIENGMTAEAFEATRTFLEKYSPLLVRTQSRRLGYALDGQYYGTGEFVPWAREQLAGLTLEQVNAAIRRHLTWENIKIVIVTGDAEGLREAIVANKPSPITYNAPKPQEILDEDKVISEFKLAIRPESASVVDIEEVFRK